MRTLFEGKNSVATTNKTSIQTSRTSSSIWKAQIATALDAGLDIHVTIYYIKAMEKLAAMAPEELKEFVKND